MYNKIPQRELQGYAVISSEKRLNVYSAWIIFATSIAVS